MLAGRLALHRGSMAGSCSGVPKSMCSVMLERNERPHGNISHQRGRLEDRKSKVIVMTNCSIKISLVIQIHLTKCQVSTPWKTISESSTWLFLNEHPQLF